MVRPSEMVVLNIIVQREGLFTPLMIADLLDVSQPMVTAHITALEKKEYIEKEHSKEDKRSFYVIPTDRAIELVKNTAEKMGEYLYQIEAALGEKTFESLLSILNDINEILISLKGESE